MPTSSPKRSTRSTKKKVSSAASVPQIYRLFFLYIEPIFALFGAFEAYFLPQSYLELTHPSTVLSTSILTTSISIVLAQLANLYLLFALNEALVLRSTNDLKVWRTVLLGLLVADFGHLWSVKEKGVWVYWAVGSWNVMDWGNVGFVYAGAATRICFLSGVGF